MRGAGVLTTAAGNVVVAHADQLILHRAVDDVVAAVGCTDFAHYNQLALNFPDEIRARLAAHAGHGGDTRPPGTDTR